MIDGDNLRFPVFDRIIATCRRNPSTEEYNNIENNMNTIIHESCEFGHISEEVYDRIGIPRDRDKILIAFECRLIKNSIGDILPYDTDITSDTSMADHLRVFTVSLGEGNSVLPSKLLSDERWVRFDSKTVTLLT